LALLRDLALALTGAAMMVLAAPPTDAWPLGLVAWVPLALVAGSHAPMRAGLVGCLQGTVAQGIALASVGAALRDTMGATPIAAAVGLGVLAVYEGARLGLVALGVAYMRKRGWPLVIAFPLALALSERFYPMFFPWSTALLFHGVPILLQGADLGGPALISLWVGLGNAALAEAWLRRAEPGGLVRFGIQIPVAVAAVVLGYGAARMRAVDEVTASAPALTIGLVQGDIERTNTGPVDPLLVYREASYGLLQKAPVDLLVWPEAAAARVVREDLLPSFLSTHIFARSVGNSVSEVAIAVPLLTGLILERSDRRMVDAATTPVHGYFNSAVLAAPAGRVLGSYDKRDLVMLGEYIPYEQSLPWLRKLLPSAGHFSAGSRAVILPLDGKRILPLICFEDILADRVRTDVEATDPDLLVDLTSDAWFGVSRLADLHLAIAQLRAVEHRRFLVHATNTGVTAVVDPAGRLVTRLPVHTRATATVSARWLRAGTVYGALGGWFERLLLLAGVLMLWLPRRPRGGSVSAGRDGSV
jgi:apolipoprotein N-acyltransferase